MIVLHYTGMPDVEGAWRGSALPAPTYPPIMSSWKTAASCNALPEAKRACMPGGVLGRRTGYQFMLDRIEIVNRGHDWGYPDFRSGRSPR